MKQKLASRIEAAATCLKNAGKKAHNKPAPSMLSPSLLAGVTAAIVIYPQAPPAPLTEAVPHLALPAGIGRKSAGTLLSPTTEKQLGRRANLSAAHPNPKSPTCLKPQ